MAKSNPLPPLERLQEVFTVDSEGRLYWKDTARQRLAGKEIKTKTIYGYLQVRLDGKTYRVHRIVWALVHGKDPGDFLVDHINGNKTDNHPSNLRLCNYSQSRLNTRLAVNNTSTIKGVTLDPRPLAKPWRAKYRGRKLGYFATKEQAADALAAAVEECADRQFYCFAFAKEDEDNGGGPK
jgi:hypothetical protein